MSKSKIIIQPTYEALHDMLGNEATLELRQAIVEQFAKHHLKAVVADPAFKMIEHRMQTYIQEELEKYVLQIKSGPYWQRDIKLSDSLKAEIDRYIAEKLQPLLTVAIEESAQRYFENVESTLMTKIETYILKVTNNRIVRLTKAILEERQTTIENTIKSVL